MSICLPFSSFGYRRWQGVSILRGLLIQQGLKCFWVIGVLSLIGCQSTGYKTYQNTDLKTSELDKKVVRGDGGVVASAHPLASQVAIDVMNAGGNAVDAAVAASFMISVVRPQSTGLGGGGFFVFRDAQRKKNFVYDFRERAPIKAEKKMYLDKRGKPRKFIHQGVAYGAASVDGGLAVGVPGLVDGLLRVHAEHGKLPLSVVMAEAIAVARAGFLIYPSLSRASQKKAKLLSVLPETAKIYFPKQAALKVGDRLVQADLANTLELIASNGRDGFYKGEVARKLIATVRKYGGVISQKDLDAYKTLIRQPLVGRVGEHTLVTMPPPSSGGVHLLQMFSMLGRFDLGSYQLDTPEMIHLTAEIMRHAFADRAKYLGDPDFVHVPVKELLSSDYIELLAAQINRLQATPSDELVHPSIPSPVESRSTTHISLVDADGNAVSTTQTINHGFGSGVVVEGAGVVLNNEMDDFSVKPGVANGFGLLGSQANEIAARKTMLSSMTPTIVLDAQERVEIVIGAPGGPRIITSVFQVLMNKLLFNLSLPEAVQKLRIHHQWLPDRLVVEQNLLRRSEKKQLQFLGHRIAKDSWFVGDIQAIARESDQSWVAVSDMRSEGVPLAQ